MKGLSKAANLSVLWLLIAAVLASKKGPTRRAAFRGIAATAGASAFTNLVGKPLFPRRRPAAHLITPHRRLSDPPTSSSFPSGHAASATAFATAVAMESPLAGIVVAPIATAVAYSRVHTGVHWPTDVAFGSAIGAGMAAATTRWWPLRPDEPARLSHPVEAPALRDGEDMLVVVNPDSGDGSDSPEEWVAEHWPKSTVLQPEPHSDLVPGLEEALDSQRASIRALGVAGGDGTVASVASVAARRNLPLAVLPAGTLNHFARDVGLEEPESASRAVDSGEAVALDLSTVAIDRGPLRWFINTASLGGYPDMVRLRERWTPRWGKWPAGAAALVRVLYESTPLDLDIDGEHHRVWVLFVGNGSYRPRGFAPTWRARLDDGLLDVRYVRADTRFSRLRFVAAALTGSLHRSRTYVQSDHCTLDVAVRRAPVALATDGEVGPEGRRFHFTAHRDALAVYRPHRELGPDLPASDG